MKVLALETSGTMGGVAIMDSEAGLLAESRINVKAVSHSERLMNEVHVTLQKCGLTIRDIDALAVAVGPGSFTGLRIGVASAKGLAFITRMPVVGVSSLEALAWSVGGLVAPMFDARRSEVYCGVYRCDPLIGPEAVIAEAAWKPEALAEHLAGLEQRLTLAGDGALAYRAVFEAALGRHAVFAPPHQMASSPAALAHLGLMRAMRGETRAGDIVMPAYIRKSEAELRHPDNAKARL